jgi:putative phosphoesterase
MKIAIISDLHANLHAVQAVAADLERVRPDYVMCLGDLVGYGAYPNEVVDFVRERNIPSVLGNNDEGVGYDLLDSGSANHDLEADRVSQASLRWTRKHTTPERKEFLRSLPVQIRQDASGGALRLLFVHGSPRRISEYLYEDRPAATFQHIAKVAGCDVLFFGHTHLAYQKWVGRTLFINAGSVGRPKDGDPRAGYVVLALPGRRAGNRFCRAEFRRVAYDVQAAARAVRESGLPPSLADLLESGGRAPDHSLVIAPRALAA